MTKEVIAILCSDLHLSHRPPTARSAEPDWYAAMERQLVELYRLWGKHHVPIICAGDIIDRWNSPPELINFALYHLPFMYCVPGQHDLPNHNIDEIHRSAYETLIKARKIEDIESFTVANGLSLYGFPYGSEIKPLLEKEKEKDSVHVAVIHKYCWIGERSYLGAPKENKLGAFKKQLKGYDAAVFGDNHVGFLAKSGDCNVLNAGTFYRRHKDEKDYKPHVGLLHEDGSISLHYMDVSKDKFLDESNTIMCGEHEIDMGDFLDGLEKLSSDPLDFQEALRHYANYHKDIDLEVKRKVLAAIG